MEAENCVDMPVDVDKMEELLKWIDENHGSDTVAGSELWTKDDWDDFRNDIVEVIEDMKSNVTYEYTYNAWW